MSNPNKLLPRRTYRRMRASREDRQRDRSIDRPTDMKTDSGQIGIYLDMFRCTSNAVFHLCITEIQMYSHLLCTPYHTMPCRTMDMQMDALIFLELIPTCDSKITARCNINTCAIPSCMHASTYPRMCIPSASCLNSRLLGYIIYGQ